MWLSLNIISKMVDLSDVTPEELADRLTLSTAEIEEIVPMNHHLRDVYTVRADSVERHPDADKLTLVQLQHASTGLQIVCGAPNHKTGDIVALAPEGTVLPGDFKIKKTKIRGAESRGMLCSRKELNLGDDHEGIMIFPEDTPLGAPLSELFPEWVDTLLEIDNKSITHRPDLWSHHGFAREIGALLGRPVKDPAGEAMKINLPEKTDLAVRIYAPEAAPRYTGLVMKGIEIAESPEWLKAAVTAIGMRPINNIVDITNYVMAEVGEPLHAFDRKKLRGNTIIVRMAADGEKLTTLDDQQHTLRSEDIVIADEGGAIALAGVMGGGNSEIDESTDEIVLEAANFDAVHIRRTAQRYGLRTDAAMRFEKSQSPELTTRALMRTCQLIMEIIPGAAPLSPLVDSYPTPLTAISITITTDEIRRRLGESIDDDRIKAILESLDFGVENKSGALTVSVPHYRATRDVSIAADIVEEIGRIYGYDNITPALPLVPCTSPARNEQRLFERKVKSILSGSCRMVETSGYSFTGAEILDKLGINEDKELRLRNPLSTEQDRLRRSMIPNIVQAIRYNSRYYDEYAFYEVGRIYMKENRTDTELATEKRRLAGAVAMKNPSSPLFYEAKAAVSLLLGELRIQNVRVEAATENLPPWAHPGRSIRVFADEHEAGIITELHPATRKAFDLSIEAALFDLDMDILFTAKRRDGKFTELQKYPTVPFDVSVITDKGTYAADIAGVIQKSDRRVQKLQVASVYEGAPIPEGKKSVSFHITFASPDHTLAPEEIEELQNKVMKRLNKEGYELR